MNNETVDARFTTRKTIDNVVLSDQKQADSQFTGWSRRVLIGALLTLGIAALFPLDIPVASWVATQIPIQRLVWLFEIMKFPGNFIFTLVIAGLLAIWHRSHLRASGFLCVSGIVSGIIGALVKWVVGRTRPLHKIPAFELHPFRGGLVGLLDAHNLSFPSGHTCLAFATAAALMVLIPRWSVAFFAVALIVAAERILQGSHYVTDVAAAAGIGVLSMYITWGFFDWMFRTRNAALIRQSFES